MEKISRSYQTKKDPNTGNRKLLHRLVIEAGLGRELQGREVVHHIDGNPSNNSIENLVLLESQSVHMRLEHYLRRKARGLECFFDLETWLSMYNKV
jgi:hypothetical protein